MDIGIAVSLVWMRMVAEGVAKVLCHVTLMDVIVSLRPAMAFQTVRIPLTKRIVVSALTDKLNVVLNPASATRPTLTVAMESWIVLLEKMKWTANPTAETPLRVPMAMAASAHLNGATT